MPLPVLLLILRLQHPADDNCSQMGLAKVRRHVELHVCCVHHVIFSLTPFLPMQLSPDFRELRGVGASDLLYVKEDIILPHSQSFYDLIVNQVTLMGRLDGPRPCRIWHPCKAVLHCVRWRLCFITSGCASCRSKMQLNNLTFATECSCLLTEHCSTLSWLQARGKSGPLFHFDVHEDVRLVNDASREKDESHAGKVVERHWYNRWGSRVTCPITGSCWQGGRAPLLQQVCGDLHVSAGSGDWVRSCESARCAS